MPEIRYYVAADGRQPFAKWFADLESIARAKVTRAVVRLEQGNFSSVKSVGEGVFEYRIDFGPGYRVYFGQDGQKPAARRSASSAMSKRRSPTGSTTSKASVDGVERR